MTTEEVLKLFEINDILYLPEAINAILIGDITKRDDIYRELLRLNNYDLSFDWFSNIYESELAQRKQNKQDFTPQGPAILCSLLTGLPKGTMHEPTAGNGSMIIADWWNRCQRSEPWTHRPSENMIDCWELSDRAIPVLLLNLSIRGIMGYVYHGDVLYQTIKMKYILLNRRDNTLGFSEIIKDPENKFKIREKDDNK